MDALSYKRFNIIDSSSNIAVEGDSIFELYDDFNGNTLDSSKWSAGTTYYSLENGFLKTWNNWGNAMIASVAKFDLPLEVEAKIYSSD